MYLFVKNNTQEEAIDIERRSEKKCSMNRDCEKSEKVSLTERALSFVSAMISGLFYGTMWLPINYMKSHADEFPEAPLDSTMYLFSFFCGVLSTSAFIFIVYCLLRRNRPWINPEAVVPSMLAGAIHAFAMSAFVIAIDNLDQAIAYPICAMLPGLVASSWSILYFREITGRQNLTRLATAYGFTLAGVALVTVSKEVAFL
ncbi:hypothetical protein OESDEN_04817 [Oesophagostomum dentatum]|uniref:EamA domain-containing protein n=1 Tax=Oesophagostomum dentatum TaxID=61180 RepID=A0A0B1TCI5_OESDE|nr:hypothetical protein OESDEN_04817 [Oesophagostomum dentatum]